MRSPTLLSKKIVAPDTNVLLRFVLKDDAEQFAIAGSMLRSVDRVWISSIVFCEFAWVLGHSYSFKRDDVAQAIERLLNMAVVDCDRVAVDIGLAALRAGAGFADGVIAAEAARQKARFISFDQRAVSAMCAFGIDAAIPGV